METKVETSGRSGRGRPSIAPGGHGEITTAEWVIDRKTGDVRRRRAPNKANGIRGDGKGILTARWTADTYVKTDSGRKRVRAHGTTKQNAIQALLTKLRPKQPDLLAEAMAAESGRPTAFTDRSTLGEVLDAWIADQVTIRARSVGTIVRYRHAIDRTIKARKVGATTLGHVELTQVTPRVVTLFLGSLTPAIAKTCRGILRQALTYAVANGASAPTSSGTFAMLSQRVERGRDAPAAPTIAITKEQAEKVIADLLADEKTKTTDLPDVFRFLAGTGCRTSEATALGWSQLDLEDDPPTVLINATINGAGKRQEHTKTRAGVRRLALPPAVAEMLVEQRAKAGPDSVLVFPSSRRRKVGRVETPYWTSNITGVIRIELDRLGHTGVTGRSFRKMVATELDKAGFTPRQIADQLGHSRPSVTMDVYQNRVAAGPADVAAIL